MRILQIITLSELGGAQSVVVNLANKLSYNHEVIVAAGEGDGMMFSLLNENIKVERIPNLVRKISPKDEIKAILQMRCLYNQYKPDIIHLHSSKAGILGRIAFPKRKIVYTVHGFDSIRVAFRKFLPLEKLLQNRCSAIVAVSKYDEKNLHAEGINKNVSCVYNGIYKPADLENNPYTKLQNFDNVILCIARLTPQKNHMLFLEVARLLPKIAFVWIGNQHKPDFEYPSNVFFFGNIPNAGSYSKWADLFMLPSNYEGLPMVIIESLANGTPIVASAVGGIPELLDGSNGFAVENNAELFADKIKSILKSDDKRNLMKKKAIEKYQSSFTVEEMTKNYLDLYQQIYSQNHTPL